MVCRESLRGLTPYRLRGRRLVPFESLNLRLTDLGRISLFPVRDSLGIVFVRFFNRPCVPARRVTFELQTGKTLVRFPDGCSQNGALISDRSRHLRSQFASAQLPCLEKNGFVLLHLRFTACRRQLTAFPAIILEFTSSYGDIRSL